MKNEILNHGQLVLGHICFNTEDVINVFMWEQWLLIYFDEEV